jgi:signal transduction histidine kinase
VVVLWARDHGLLYRPGDLICIESREGAWFGTLMPLSKMPKRRASGTSHFGTDWAICLVRWGLLALVPVLVLLDPADRLTLEHMTPYILAVAAYNLAVTLLLIVGFFPRIAPPLTLIADLLSALALLYLSRGALSLFFFFPLFPILVAALRFGWRVGLLTAGIFVISYGLLAVLAWTPGQPLSGLFDIALYGLLFLLAAVVPSVVSISGDRAGQKDAAAAKVQVPDHLKVIYEMAAALSATMNYERVLEAILDIGRLGLADLGERIGESAGMVLLYDQAGLFPATHRNLVARGDESRHIAGKQGIVEQAISLGQAIVGTDPASDPELKEFQSLQPCRSVICVPLRAGFETYGVVVFASVNRDAYTGEHVDLLTIFCNQATIALQNASLYQSLREERDKIVDKEEQARRKLARDLHDGPTQDIAAIAMRLNFARVLLDRDLGRARSELERLEDMAHRTVKEIRSMLFTLRPVILETEGLVAALNQYADNVRENDGLPVIVDAERYRDCLDTEAQGVVFSIVEEAVNNARKHARATRVQVRLSVQEDLFVAQVEDNGHGFDLQSVEQNYGSRGSLGMINLKERAALIDGTLNIESTPGEGTRVILLVPLHDELI